MARCAVWACATALLGWGCSPPAEPPPEPPPDPAHEAAGEQPAAEARPELDSDPEPEEAAPANLGEQPSADRNPADGNRPAWGEFSASFTENVHGGNGWAWVATIGGSPRDFPGPGAALAGALGSLSPARVDLVTASSATLAEWSQIPAFCRGVRAADKGEAEVAVGLPAAALERNPGSATGRTTDDYWSSDCPGCPGAPTAADLARREDDSSLERHATAGTSLLLLEPPPGSGGVWSAQSLREKLMREVFRPPHPDWSILRLGREAARRLGTELRLSAPLPAALGRDNLWPAAGMLDLVEPVARPGEILDPWRRLAIHRTLRSRGKRPLLRLPKGAAYSADRLLQEVALFLISGGSVLFEAPGEVPEGVRQAMALAQKHPEFFFLRGGRVGLYYSLASMVSAEPGGAGDPHGDGVTAQDFFGLARLLDELHIPYKVVFAGDGVSVDDAFESERLGLYDTVVVPRSARLSEVEHRALGDMSRVGAVVLSGASAGLDLRGEPRAREPLAPSDGRRMYVLDQHGSDYLADPSAPRRSALAGQLKPAMEVLATTIPAAVASGLPAHVLVERFLDPRSSTLVHQVLNLAGAGSRTGRVARTQPTWMRFPAWPRRADLDYDVRLWSPDNPKGTNLEYRWLAESAELEVQLPALGVWTVLSVRPQLRAASAKGSGRITIEAPAFDPDAEARESRQVTFEVPAWSGGRRKLTLRAPEDIISASGIAGLGENLRADWERAADGSQVTLRASNQHISVTIEAAVTDDYVDITTTIKNVGSALLERVEAMFCLDPGDLHPFPESGLDRNWLLRDGIVTSMGSERHGSGTPNFSEGTAFDLPMTVLESVDERWSLGHAFEETEILGANGSGGGVCIHTRPRFGDLHPGLRATRKGRIYMARSGAPELFARLVREQPFPFPPPPPATAQQAHPCLSDSGAN